MTSNQTLRTIGPLDTALHPTYCDYVLQVFRQADFRRWCAWDQWSEDYRAFCVFQDDRVIANVSASRMELWVDGQPVDGFQLGAVGCLPEFRGQGLARRAMQAALAHCGQAPVCLFANETVLDFYPRFGFAAAEQSLFETEFAAEPVGERVAALDLGDARIRGDFLAAARIARPSSRRFGARDYGRIATWYAANGYASELRCLDEATWVFAQVEDGVLFVEDVFASRPFDLLAAVPRLIDRPVRAVRFGFTPERAWPGACAVGIEADAGLFVRNLALPDRASRFPLLART
ncbi:MAG: GNAT family N-acetyltransferase [Lysobacter sp.]